MKIIVVTGQTATGKTKLAVEIAKKNEGELVNFDSRQVYKYLDIITGKDLPASRIHLYDIVYPNQYFSSFEFVKMALPVLSKIVSRKKTPVLVGGSYFYLKHLLYGFSYSVKPNDSLRKILNHKTVPELKKILVGLNPVFYESMNKSDRLNPRRIIRKIEIAKSLKIEKKPYFFPYKPEIIGLRFENKIDLVTAIKKRVKERIDQGALNEVRNILAKGYTLSDPGLKTIGYRELADYIDKKVSFENAVEKWITSELQYAKRQYTFMKKDSHISWRNVKSDQTLYLP